MGRGVFKDELEKELEAQSSRYPIDNQLIEDIVDSYLVYGATPNEYFNFGFMGLDHERRNSFLTNQYKDKVLISTIGIDVYLRDLRDKYSFYKLVGKYFKRDVLALLSKDDLHKFKIFCSKHNNFIAKPLTGMCGSDVQIFHLGKNDDLDALFENLLSKDKYIIEELIQQTSEFKMWNPSSVNTIRIPSFLIGGKHRILRPFMRVGRKGAIVDNGAAGGVFAVIDEKTGIVISDGFDEKGGQYRSHPDSCITFKGYEIPLWNELLNLAKEIHETLPSSHKYVAFDFALTDGGWVLIEGNWGIFLSEYALKEGLKDTFNKIIRGNDI